MSKRTWFTDLFDRMAQRTSCSRSQRRPPRRERDGRRPGLEVLEARWAPATLTVNSLADTASPTDPYLTLREAVAIVNSPSLPDGLSPQILAQIGGILHADGADAILFDPALAHFYIALGGTQLELSLPGTTAAVTIDGGSGGVVDGTSHSRVFQVDAGARVTLAHLTIEHGRSRDGGGVYNAGTLTVSDSTLTSNFADYSGGAISNTGTLTVSRTGIDNNSADAYDGGAEAGGGIYSEGTLTVTDSDLFVNSAGFGGGIYNLGAMTATNCEFASNHAEWGSFGESGGDGGGIYNGGTATVSNSTLDYNSALGRGGGIYNPHDFSLGIEGTLTVSNSTLSFNSTGDAFSTDRNGGGIYNGGTLTVISSTLSSNTAFSTGGGLYNPFYGTASLQNTIVAGNTGSSGSMIQDIQGPVSGTSSYNLVGDGTGLSGISNGVNYNQIGTSTSRIDPLLAPLDYYGGPNYLPMYALRANSPALDAGDPSLAGTPDERGVVRTGGVNIGAFQASASTFVLTAPASVTAGTPFDLTVRAKDSFGQPAVGYTGTAHLSSSDGQAVLPDDHTFTLTDGGSYTFPGVALRTAGTWTITATDAGSLTGTGTVTVRPAAADHILLSGPASASAGIPFDLTVTIQDAYGNTVTDYAGTVTFSTDDPNGSVPADYTFTADDAGTHTFVGGVTLYTDGSRVTATDTQMDSLTGSIVVPLG
jgi:hypothetical protein